jgi:O-antigen/teichoic acid export membrane protein
LRKDPEGGQQTSGIAVAEWTSLNKSSVTPDPVWGDDTRPFHDLARNVSTRYLAYAIDAGIGLVMLPFNLAHLGKPVYGLWMLTASITTSFALLDLGYGGSLVRFIARYRALRDSKGLNEILSTLFVVYSMIGLATFAGALLMTPFLSTLFRIPPEQLPTARYVFLIIASFVALRFMFSVYGGVVVGFQRYHLNNMVSIAMSIAVAMVNVAVLLAGVGLIGLVAATTLVRALGLFVYRQNAHRAYPALRINPFAFSRSRLREVTGFSIYMLLLDCGSKLNYNADTMVIGAFMGTAAIALWTPAQRLTELLTRLTNQLNDALFPMVVESHAAERTGQLRTALIQATRLSLAIGFPVAGGVALLAHQIIRAWVGPTFTQTATVLQLLAALVVLRVGMASSYTILRGAGEHKRLTIYVGLTGIVNLLLSIALVHPLGIVGVALGTVIPVATMAPLVVFPTACRRVGLSALEGFRQAVWPAVWPALTIVVCLRLAMPLGGLHLMALAVKLAIAAILYEAVFFGLAIGGKERQLYWRMVRELLPRPLPGPAIAQAVTSSAQWRS